MRLLQLLALSHAILTCSNVCSAREFGPEWTKSADGYSKDTTVTVVSLGPGQKIYRVQLVRDFLQIAEIEDYPGFYLMWNNGHTGFRMKKGDRSAQPVVTTPLRIGYIDVSKTSNGPPASHKVNLPGAGYLDLNGDGIFDVRVRNSEVSIMYGDQLILVEGHARGLGTNTREARTRDGTRYIFDGAWRVAKFREAPPMEPAAEQRKTARELGPEWREGKDPLTGLEAYLKELKVPVVHPANGNVAHYSVQLEHDRLQISEVDDNQGFSVSWQENGRVDIRRNKDGTPAWHQVRFPKARYLDLNGDGIFDIFVDFRQDSDGEASILLDNQFTAVQQPSGGISETMRNAESADGQRYVFVGDKWQVKN